jgi:hypothetical protein
MAFLPLDRHYRSMPTWFVNHGSYEFQPSMANALSCIVFSPTRSTQQNHQLFTLSVFCRGAGVAGILRLFSSRAVAKDGIVMTPY